MATSTQIAPDAPRKVFLLLCPEREFLVPYLERQLGPGWDIVTRLADTNAPDRALMISSTEIYNVEQGLNYDETTEVYAESSWHAHEKMFEAYCRQRSLAPVIVRCAYIVGTGMTGLPMLIARRIHSGTMRHIADPRPRHETRLNRGRDLAPVREHAMVSVVHAVDVALAADLLTRPGRTPEESEIFNLTDNCATDADRLVDALASRVNNKHVPAARPFWARILNGTRLTRFLTTSFTFNPAKIIRATGITPNVVTEYLTTHVYDENSL